MPSNRLDSWKEVAAYLRRDVRTVQRWEKEAALPIHRHLHKKLGAVYAYSAELDDWWKDGRSRLAELEGPVAPQEAGPSPSNAQPGQGLPVVGPSGEPGTAAIADRKAGLTQAPSGIPRRSSKLLIGALIALLVFAALLGYALARLELGATSPTLQSLREVVADTTWKDSLATDGTRIYYTGRVGNQATFGTANVSDNGGPGTVWPARLAHPKILSIVPGATRLLLGDSAMGKAGPLVRMVFPNEILGTISGVTAARAEYSPDTDWIAFCRGDSVFRVHEWPTQPERLASFQGTSESVAWSPDGKSLRVVVMGPKLSTFIRPFGPTLSLFQIDIQSRTVRAIPLPPPPLNGVYPCGASIAWQSDYFVLALRCSGSSSVWLLPNRQSVTSQRQEWIQLSAVFSRITQIAWSGDSFGLIVLDEVSGPTRLVQYDPKTDEWAPVQLGINPVELDYSRDGKWVTYVEHPERTLWRAQADGQHALQLTRPPMKAQLPHWSPDGTRIGFSGMTPGSPWRAYLIGASGGGLRSPIPAIPSGYGAPTWSPDGSSFVVGEIDDAAPSTHFAHLFDLHTGRLTTIPGSGGTRTARWSPDGRYIAANRYGEGRLALFDSRTSQWTDVCDGLFEDTLNWSFDSRFVYFDDGYEPHPGVFRYDVVDHRVEPVLSFGPYRKGGDINADVSGFSVGPDGSILVNAAGVTSRIYALKWKE